MTLREITKRAEEEQQRLSLLLATLNAVGPYSGTRGQADHRLAEYLHYKFCFSNHTDACSWFYENDRESPWEESTHKKALEYARKLLDGKKIDVWF